MRWILLLFLGLGAIQANAADGYDRLQKRLMALENKVFEMSSSVGGLSGGGSEVKSEVVADLEVRFQQLEEENRKLYGAVEELGHAVEELARKVDVISRDQEARIKDIETKGVKLAAAVDAKTAIEENAEYIPPDLTPEQHYQKAYNFLTTAAYDKAEGWFKAFLQRHPQNSLAENTMYWLGEIYLVKKDPKQAIISFTNGLKQFPDGQKVPANLLKMGVAFERLNQFNHAKNTWKKLVEEFPDSAESQKARKMLEEIG